MKEAHTKTDGVEARARWGRLLWTKKPVMAFQLVVDNPDFLFLVPSQRLKRLNHHPQWCAGNFGENYDAQVKIPRSPISIAR
jgi:hypothetical protein